MPKFSEIFKKTLCLGLSTAILGVTSGGLNSVASKGPQDGGYEVRTEVFQTSSAYDLGIDASNVRLGWRIVTEKRGVIQDSYNLVVTGEDGNVAWDSGWVKGREQTGVRPENLKPETVYSAKVSIKTTDGVESGFGKELVFETAPSTPEGVWLNTSRLLRQEFTLDRPASEIKRARIYFASTGIIEIRLNGSKVGDLIWGPRKSVPDKIAYYNTFDVTGMLKDGVNCVGAYVGGGTYLGKCLRGMLRIIYKDGSVQTVATGEGWQSCANSEIVTENLSKGEDINLTKRTEWDTAGFKTGSGWKKAEQVSFSAVSGELTVPDNSGTFTTYDTFEGNYTVEAVLTVNKNVAAIEFGAKDGVSSPLMWQVTNSGLRLHHVGWTEIETPSAKGLGANKKVTMRIEIQDGTVTTFINGNKVHSGKFPKSQTDGALGIRSAVNEVATYDRITVTKNGEVVWEDNFDTVDSSKWTFPGEPELVPAPAGTKVIEEIKPVSSTKIEKKGKTYYILDFGVNMQGYVKMTVKGNAKDKYKIEYSEMLDETGDIWPNTTAHKPVSNYTLSGNDDVFEPRFFYTGFRYIRVTPPESVAGSFDPDIFTACFTSDDVPQTGFFESSDERLNKVFEMYRVSQRSNMMGNYTDCPQREKNGWTGDAAVTKESAAVLLADWPTAEAYLDAMLLDIKKDGRPEIVVPRATGTESGAQYDITWASAIFIFPYELYMQTGDKYYVEHSLDRLYEVFEYAKKYEKDYIVTQNVYGDWVGFDNGAGKLDSGFLSAACFYNCGMLLAEMTDIAGRDSTALRKHMSSVYDAIQKKYFKKDYYATRSQTCCSMALDFGLVPAKNVKKVLGSVIEVSEEKGRTLGTGVLGTKSIYDALSAANEHKLLLDMTVSHEKCSFGFMIDNGATSLWEYWDTPGNNFNSHQGDFLAFFDSLNHVMLGGGPACWMFGGIGGVKATGAGYRNITYRPGLESGLTHAKTSVESVAGLCVSDWTYENGILKWNVTVPANSTASVIIPVKDAKSIRESGVSIYKKDGDGIKYEGTGENGEFLYTFGGGTYVIETGLTEDPDVDDGNPGGNKENGKKITAAIVAGSAAVVAAGTAVVTALVVRKKKKA
ncbi:MAG: family 78 glycoside hydrolase catalytic domain [Clostridia bacterium]|nr:family 78 glycoside hydrolase catalytic domain [Clostridia bacterium]